MVLTLNISPCPNDTFMFDAMINGRIDTESLEFDVRFADIEELNRAVREPESKPHISKVSYAVAGEISCRYDILTAGSALGRGNGPLWVSADKGMGMTDYSMRVAIPGQHTTANMLMSALHPHIVHKQEVLFSEIADAVAKEEFDAGVLIHEGRFTFISKGLHLIADLGAEWERTTGLPLPLGAIAISNELDPELKSKVNRVLSRSVKYALDNPGASSVFVAAHAQEMDPEVTRKHIALFVNDYSVSLGEEGKKAVRKLLGNAGEKIRFIE